MAELADAPDLGSGPRGCRFKSCYPHYHPLMIQGIFYFIGNCSVISEMTDKDKDAGKVGISPASYNLYEKR